MPLTSDLQFALHHILALVVNSFAHVHAAVEGTWLTDLQRQNTLLRQHAILGFIGDVHFVFVPGHFGLMRQNKT